MIRTQLRRELDGYLSKGPHVAAARKIEKTGIPAQVGMTIEYYIGEAPGKLVRDKVFLPEEKLSMILIII